MPGLSIGEVARRAGIRASAIRYYEKIGLLPRAARVGGRRRYDESVLERLAMVRFAKRVGFSVAEVKTLLDGVHGRPPTERWREIASKKASEVDQLIADATNIRRMLQETLDHKCPHLVERGHALSSPRLDARTKMNRPRGRS